MVVGVVVVGPPEPGHHVRPLLGFHLAEQDAGEGAQVDLLDAEVDPDLGQVLLEELDGGLDVLVPRLHGQDELGAFGHARRGEQLARLVQVGRVLKRLRIEAGHELGDAADGALAVAPEDALDHLVVGERPAHRLPRLRRRQWPGLGQDQVVDLGTVGAVDDQIRVRGQRLVRFRGEVVDDVDLPLLDQLAPRLVLRDDPEDDAVEVVAFPAAPVVVIALQDQLLLRLELDDPVGSGPQPFFVQLRPGVALKSPSASFCMTAGTFRMSGPYWLER